MREIYKRLWSSQLPKGTAEDNVTLWFSGDSGINISHSTNIHLRGQQGKASIIIDYDPPPPPNPTFKEKSGITLQLYNCTQVVVQDVVVRAAPFMAVTAFQGGGDHIFRRLRFVPRSDRTLVAVRDAIHFSDLRKGPTILDSNIGYSGDDFLNVHTTLLLVLECDRTTQLRMECLLVNPRVMANAKSNTVYGTFSVLPFVVSGDHLSFFAWPSTDMVMSPLIQSAVVVQLEDVSEVYGHIAQRALPPMLEYPPSMSWHEATNQTHKFDAGEVWRVVLEMRHDFSSSALPPPVGIGTIATIDTIATAGAKLINNTFLHSHCNLGRFKSPGGVIQGNVFHQAWKPNLELTALPQFLEGPVDVRDILVADNLFLGVGPDDPVHCGPFCEKPECHPCYQCPHCHRDTPWARNITLRNNTIIKSTDLSGE
ncbi:expressed unknown protein [Seminavis robusta]|uniref:Uncharacterized protein n=1 Tax=Seminavis robusta TaxID=568900 RepID=A0A9N8D915_9STRA|nr:expressed unknown protein [Seminavis robusta]|eukprot:Sro20_g013940.1 n/a (425) ;mRNA; f:39502-40868